MDPSHRDQAQAKGQTDPGSWVSCAIVLWVDGCSLHTPPLKAIWKPCTTSREKGEWQEEEDGDLDCPPLSLLPCTQLDSKMCHSNNCWEEGVTGNWGRLTHRILHTVSLLSQWQPFQRGTTALSRRGQKGLRLMVLPDTRQ